MADPHGIALDTSRNELFVSNWGTNNDRPPLSEGGGGDDRHNRTDFPVGRARAVPGSGMIHPPSITVYPKGAEGDTPPLRVIQGPKTQMDWPTSLAVHPDRGELFVANDNSVALSSGSDFLPSPKSTGCRALRTGRKVSGPPIRGESPAVFPPSAQPASFPANHSAATATAARSLPTTMPWPRPCAKSGSMIKTAATTTRASASTVGWIPSRPPFCSPNWSALTGKSSAVRKSGPATPNC